MISRIFAFHFVVMSAYYFRILHFRIFNFRIAYTGICQVKFHRKVTVHQCEKLKKQKYNIINCNNSKYGRNDNYFEAKMQQCEHVKTRRHFFFKKSDEYHIEEENITNTLARISRDVY